MKVINRRTSTNSLEGTAKYNFMRSQITVAYQSANEEVANLLTQLLNNKGVETNLLSEKEFSEDFFNQFDQAEKPVFLVLTDNWLKDERCLLHSLEGLRAMEEQKELQVIITSGISEDGQPIPTNIKTLRDAIKYMQYWQEMYLASRKAKNVNPLDHQLVLQSNRHREVSTGIGDIINFFRDTNILTADELTGEQLDRLLDQFDVEMGDPLDQEEVEVHHFREVMEPTEKEEQLEDIFRPAEEQELPQDAMEDTSDAKTSGLFRLDIQEELEDNGLIDKVIADTPKLKEDTIIEEGYYEEDVFEDDKEETIVEGDDGYEESEQEMGDGGDSLNDSEDINVSHLLTEATTLFNEDRDEEGFALFEEAIANGKGKKNLLRYYYAYYLAQRKRDFDGAIHQLDSILTVDQKNDNAYFLLAELAELKQNFALAKNYYQQVKEINPDYPAINYRLGVLLQDYFKGYTEKAAKYFKSEIKKEPDNIDAIYRLGIIQNEYFEDIPEAIKQFNKVIDKDHQHPFAHYDLAVIYHNKGDHLKGAYYYQQACSNNPEVKTAQNDEAFLWKEGKEKVLTEKEIQDVPIVPVATKTVLITGATSGIGLATAKKFAEAGGYRIITTGRRLNKLNALKKSLKENYNTDTLALQFDVRDKVQVHEALSSIQPPFDHIDILVNNAGLALGLEPFESADIRHWETMIDTNVKGLLYVTQQVARHMILEGNGHIINIGSIAGREAYPKGSVYNASKAAVDMLTRAIRLDLHQHNIRVSQVAPGHVEDTEFALTRFDGDQEKAKIYQDFQPLKAEDIANIIYFITTQPDHVNIQDLLVFATQQASATVIHRSGR